MALPPVDPATTIPLVLTTAEVNLVLKYLAKGPLEEVLDVFAKVKSSAEGHIRSLQAVQLSNAQAGANGAAAAEVT